MAEEEAERNKPPKYKVDYGMGEEHRIEAYNNTMKNINTSNR